MIIIPTGRKHYRTVTASKPKAVACESCGKEYVYMARRAGRGRGNSPLWLREAQAKQEAATAAQSALNRALRAAVDPVPCPECGNFQASMIKPARRSHMRRIKALVLWLGLPGLALMGVFWQAQRYFPEWKPALVLSWIGQIAFVAAVGLFFYRLWKCAHFDPNSMPVEKRLRIGKNRAMIKSEFLKLAAANKAVPSRPFQV